MRSVAFGSLLILSAFGQTSTHSVKGTVRNEVTGEPIGKALVYLVKVPSGNPFESAPIGEAGGQQEKLILSGPGGEFHFEGLADGLYAYGGEKPGFARDGSPANLKTFAIPRSAADAPVQIQLSPLGAIEGKVVNQYDEPLESVLLDVYQVRVQDGEKILNPVGAVWTNDRGLFHVAWIEPGNYLVKVVGMNGGTETHFGPYPTQYAAWEGFSSIYFGGAVSAESAAPILVAAGARVRADFRLEVERSFKISGQLQGYVGPESVSFELIRGDDRNAPSRALLDVTTGKFAILDVTPGKYKLRATLGKTRGEVTVTVGADDLNGVSLPLSPPATIIGSRHSLGGRSDGLCHLNLHQRWYPETITGRTVENGGFSLDNVFPGQYQVRIVCFGAYVQSTTSGTVDLLKNPDLTISLGAPAPPLEVVYVPGGGSLKVKLANPVPPTGAVLLVPTFSAAAGPVLRPANTRDPTRSEEVTVQFLNLAPGDYIVYGLPRFEEVEFRNPTFLQSLSGGIHVRIEDGRVAEVAIARIFK